MLDTSISLLERIRRPDDHLAWRRFVHLYAPLLHFWARKTGLHEADASDLVQDVFPLLVEKLPEFRYDASRSFRGWLRTVLINRGHNLRRRPSTLPLDDVQQPPESPDVADLLAEEEYRQKVVGRALRLMKTDFEPSTWKAFWECQVNDRPAAEIAAELGMSPGAVYGARSRVLNKLRAELEGLLD